MNPHSVLIVDDEQGFRELLVEALRTDVVQVESAPDAETALTMAEEKHYPVILTDLNLPGNLSGLDLIRSIRAMDRRAFCIVMTGNATTEVAIQALKEGAYDFILKPFTLVEIKASLRRTLSHYATLRENEAYQAQLEEMVAERTGEIKGHYLNVTAGTMEQMYERFFSTTHLSTQVMETGSRIAHEIADALEIAGRRHDAAAVAEDRLHHHGRDPLRMGVGLAPRRAPLLPEHGGQPGKRSLLLPVVLGLADP